VAKSVSGNSTTYDMRLIDALGKVYITIEQFQSTDITNLVRTPKLCDVGYQTEWIDSKLRGNSLDLTRCIVIVLKDKHGIASSFMEKIASSSNTKVGIYLSTNK
jgi:hypothetical protein